MSAPSAAATSAAKTSPGAPTAIHASCPPWQPDRTSDLTEDRRSYTNAREYNQGRPDYDAVVGAAARMQRALDGRQPGDPARAAQVILEVAAMDQPLLRLPLASDAVKTIKQADRAKPEELERWRELSSSTDVLREEHTRQRKGHSSCAE